MINLTQVCQDTPLDGVQEIMKKVVELRQELDGMSTADDKQSEITEEMFRHRAVFFTMLNENVNVQSSNQATLTIQYKDCQITKQFVGLVNIGGLPLGTRITVTTLNSQGPEKDNVYKATLVDGYYKRPGEVRKEDLKW